MITADYTFAVVFFRNFAAATLVLLACTAHAAGEDFPIKPHAEIQSLIVQLMTPVDGADEATAWRTLGSLQRLAADDNGRFVEQVVFYVAHMKEKVLSSGVLRLFGYCQIPQTTQVEVMARYAYCNNEQLRKEARRILGNAVQRGNYQNYLDLSHFAHVVRNDLVGDDIAGPSNRWIFETAPNSAFLLFDSIADRKDLLRLRRLERVISNALFDKQYMGGIEGGRINKETEDVVRELAKSPHWWARLFVAETIVQNYEFRLDDVIASLSKDSDPLVKQSIASLKKDDPLRATSVDTGRFLQVPPKR